MGGMCMCTDYGSTTGSLIRDIQKMCRFCEYFYDDVHVHTTSFPPFSTFSLFSFPISTASVLCTSTHTCTCMYTE